MDMLSPRPAEPQPDFERERDKVIAAAAARLHRAQRPPRPRASGPEHREADPQEAELARRVAELEERLAAAESTLARAVEARQRAEESLANTQLEHLKALERIRALEASERAPAVAEAAPASPSPPTESEPEPEPEPAAAHPEEEPSPWDQRPTTPVVPVWRPAPLAPSPWAEPVAASETGGPVVGGHEDQDRVAAGSDRPEEASIADDGGSLRSRLIAAANARRGTS